MAHEIFERSAYSRMQPMWHGLGVVSQKAQTAVEAMTEHFEGGFDVILREINYILNGEENPTGDYAVIRGAYGESEEKKLAFCTDRYHPLQPIEVAHCFDENVGEPIETMAFLRDGAQMFISWSMPETEIEAGDPVELYGITDVGFDTKHGANLMTSVVRPVCANTLTFAENWANENTDKARGKGKIWSGKATSRNLLRDLGYWMAHVQENALREAIVTTDILRTFAQTPIVNDAEVDRLLAQAFPTKNDPSENFPKQLRDAKRDAIALSNAKVMEHRNGIARLFQGAGTAIKPSYWGLLNATTEYHCHYMKSKKPIAESVISGNRAKMSAQMVNTLRSNLY